MKAEEERKREEEEKKKKEAEEERKRKEEEKMKFAKKPNFMTKPKMGRRAEEPSAQPSI